MDRNGKERWRIKGRVVSSSPVKIKKVTMGNLGKWKEYPNSFMLVREQKGWFWTSLMKGASRMVLFSPHTDSQLALLLCTNFQKQICTYIRSIGDYLHVFMPLSTDLGISQCLPTAVLSLRTPGRRERQQQELLLKGLRNELAARAGRHRLCCVLVCILVRLRERDSQVFSAIRLLVFNR